MASKPMTDKEARTKLAAIARAKGGELSKSGRFVDLPNNPDCVGYSIVPARSGKGYVIVSVPR
jgi:hypothetical protein